MNITLLQPEYPHAAVEEAARNCVEWIVSSLGSISPGGTDLILLPEYSNAPGLSTHSDIERCVNRTGKGFLETLSLEAKRIDCIIAAGIAHVDGSTLRNRTILVDRKGHIAAYHDKTHLTEVETADLEVVPGYRLTTCEIDEVRYGFAMCFELYFSEYFASIAALRPDVILAPSYQRGESRDRIRSISQVRAIDTGCWLLRSSYAMGGETGGHSLVAHPDGTIVLDLGNTPSMKTIEIDPLRRFVKPSSFGGDEIEHRVLVESHRSPGLYRERRDRAAHAEAAPLPRLCAHRGLSTVCPENTCPAFGAAIAAGAAEIEFDLWMSADGVPVVCHDETLDRTTDGGGRITHMSWSDIKRLDAGAKSGDGWRGVAIPRLEEVLELVEGRVVMNIHIKDAGPDGLLARKVLDILDRHYAREYSYIAGDVPVIEAVRRFDPEIECACLDLQDEPEKQVSESLRLKCNRIQFASTIVDRQRISAAKELGILANLFYSDVPDEAARWVRDGIDVVLTNCAHAFAKDWSKSAD